MKEVRKEGRNYFILDVLGRQNAFEIVSDETENNAKNVLINIENNINEELLQSIARMHSCNIPLIIQNICLVKGSQNIHEAVRIYNYLSNSKNEKNAEDAKKDLEYIKRKYSTKLSMKYYYLKVGRNFIYLDNGMLCELNIKSATDLQEFRKTLKGIERESKISQYNMGVRLQDEGNEEYSEQFYKKSAEQGYVNAQYNLGLIMKKKGDLQGAKKMFSLAAKQGDEIAKKQIEKINCMQKQDHNSVEELGKEK